MRTFFLGENRERGTYKPCFSSERRTAFICCPDCGALLLLNPHIVASDGTVTPSVACRPPCDFHEFIRLDKWS